MSGPTAPAETGPGSASRDRFIAHLWRSAAVPERDSTASGTAPLRQLAAASFLVGPEVTEFVERTLFVLLRQLSRVDQPERILRRGQVRGRIDWPQTWKARLAEHDDPTVFVCRQLRRDHATPENELLVWVIDRLLEAAENLPEPLRRGVFWYSGEEPRARSVRQRLHRMVNLLQSHRLHVYLREIEPPERITGRHLLRARSSKNELYARVAAVYERYVAVTIDARGEAMERMLERCLVLPRDPDGPGGEMIRLAAARLAGRIRAGDH